MINICVLLFIIFVCSIYLLAATPTSRTDTWQGRFVLILLFKPVTSLLELAILSSGYLKIHADWEFCPWLYHFFIPSIKAMCRLNCLHCQIRVLKKIASFWTGYFPIPDDIAKIFSKLPFWLWQILCGWPVVGWHQFRLGSFPSPSPGTPRSCLLWQGRWKLIWHPERKCWWGPQVGHFRVWSAEHRAGASQHRHPAPALSPVLLTADIESTLPF